MAKGRGRAAAVGGREAAIGGWQPELWNLTQLAALKDLRISIRWSAIARPARKTEDLSLNSIA
jgi:hypothetical protein